MNQNGVIGAVTGILQFLYWPRVRWDLGCSSFT